MMTSEYPRIVELESKISLANIISFDFFDTLFVRPLCHPEDAFDVLAKRFGIDNFRKLRKTAQTAAFQRMHERGRKEISLADIYECFPATNVPANILMQAEYDLELALVYPNPELIEVFNRAVSAGKKVVVTSDMYLTEDFFVKAFDQYGIKQVPMFISAEKNATKRDAGELFTVLAKSLNVPCESILHIGDNEHADVKQAQAKNIQAFHYLQSRQVPQLKQYSPEASAALGLIQLQGAEMVSGSVAESGFLYGGPATFAFLRWIEQQATKDKVDHVLFVSRDGYLLNRIVEGGALSNLPRSCYFFGSRTAFTLASITDTNFISYLPFLLSGADELSPFELLARIGVPAPPAELMDAFGLGDGTRVNLGDTVNLQRFLYAYRWEILKVCRRNRQGLFNYLLELGLDSGQKVALVDVGWNGSTQESFESALNGLMDLDVHGYYFCLADTPECAQRRSKYHMSALFSVDSVSPEVIADIYKNRVTIEMFFSAPHNTVIGLESTPSGVVAIEDPGRGTGDKILASVDELVEGGKLFFEAYESLLQTMDFPFDCVAIASPMIEFATNNSWHQSAIFSEMDNFDTWASSENKKLNLSDYV